MASLLEGGVAWLWSGDCGIPRATLVDSDTGPEIVERCSTINGTAIAIALAVVGGLALAAGAAAKHEPPAALSRSESSTAAALLGGAGTALLLSAPVVRLATPWLAGRRFAAAQASYAAAQANGGSTKAVWVDNVTNVARTQILATAIVVGLLLAAGELRQK
jgi:uncharacterized membrane protein YidH (DUF202 family)